MQKTFTTKRIYLRGLEVRDKEFILELLNTDGWLRFIGNRKVNSPEEAENYIQRILNNPDVFYWVAETVYSGEAIGVITLIKRNYLDHHDIGFAFLPAFTGLGYAREASDIILRELLGDPGHQQILATTLPDNTRSIALLEKLGMQFDREIEVETQKLLLYKA